MGRTTGRAAALAVVILTLAACTGSDDDGTSQTEPTAETEVDGSEGAAAEGAAGAAQATVRDSVLAEQTFDTPGGEGAGGTLTTAITALEVKGETMTLRWTLRWDNDEKSSSETVSLSDLDARNMPSVTDPANLKVYMPLCTEGSWQGGAVDQMQCGNSALVSPSESVFFQIPNHATVEAWAMFPAPQDEIDTVDVMLVDGWPTFTDVEVVDSGA